MSRTQETITDIVDLETNSDKFFAELEFLYKLSDQEFDALLEPLKKAKVQPQKATITVPTYLLKIADQKKTVAKTSTESK
jgi:hypothetical protein